MHDPPTTVVGLMHVSLHIPLCQSLKEKRSVVRPCIQHLQRHFNLAVAEVADQDVWRTAVLAVAAVSGDRTCVEQALRQARRYLERHRELEVVDLNIELI